MYQYHSLIVNSDKYIILIVINNWICFSKLIYLRCIFQYRMHLIKGTFLLNIKGIEIY